MFNVYTSAPLQYFIRNANILVPAKIIVFYNCVIAIII